MARISRAQRFWMRSGASVKRAATLPLKDIAKRGARVKSMSIDQTAEQILARLPERFSHFLWTHARATPHHPALVEGATVWSYSRLASIVAHVGILLARLRIRPGDRLMIVSENFVALTPL